jgi:hypothetical protein
MVTLKLISNCAIAIYFISGMFWSDTSIAQNNKPAKPALTINPDSYVSASNEEWGQLMWDFKLFNQPLDEFANFDEPNDAGLAANRFIDTLLQLNNTTSFQHGRKPFNLFWTG